MKNLAILFVLATYLNTGAKAILLNVPNYTQCYPSWGSDPIGTCSDTICDVGCVITSISMLYEYYNELNHWMDPGELDNCLTNNGGYFDDCLFIWNSGCRPEGVSFYGETSFNESIINEDLNSGYPVLVNVNFGPYGHTVLIIGNEDGQFQIRDPLGYQNVLSGYPEPYGPIRRYRGNIPTNIWCPCP